MNIALIKAGGTGKRMENNIPKQFICIQNKPIILYTLETLEQHPSIDAIVVVCLDGWHDVLWAYAKQYHITKLVSIVSGGETSLKSIREGFREIQKRYSPEDIVLIHDGNRPVVTLDIISDVIAKCNLYGSAVAAVPCTDEIMKANGTSLESDQFLDRKLIYRIQTPEAYRLNILDGIFSHATENQLSYLNAVNTLMITLGGKVHFAQGGEINIRLTTGEDILLCESLLALKQGQAR